MTNEGGCVCGAVRFTATGEPKRVGLCHCMTCRKRHAAAFYPFAVFAREQVSVTGETRGWTDEHGNERRFCPVCGSGVIDGVPGVAEVEVSLGSFDRPGLFAPGYESWTIRREPWLAPLAVAQNERDPAP